MRGSIKVNPTTIRTELRTVPDSFDRERIGLIFEDKHRIYLEWVALTVDEAETIIRDAEVTSAVPHVAILRLGGLFIYVHMENANTTLIRELSQCLDALRLEQEQQAFADGRRREGAPA